MSSNISISNLGPGPQNIATGSGPQYNNNGGGAQFVNSTFHDRVFFNSQTKSNETKRPGSGKPTRRDEFRIAIICALPLEFDAALLVFDQIWDTEDQRYGKATGDTNTYTTGRIGAHNIVLILLPGMGTSAATGAAAGIRSSYPGRLLGDVVISKSVQHALGRQYPSGFVTKNTMDDNLGRPNLESRSLIASLETESGNQILRRMAGDFLIQLQDAAKRQQRLSNYQYPGIAEDRLFAADYRHKHQSLCDMCEKEPPAFCNSAARATCAELRCDERQLQGRERLAEKHGLSEKEAQAPRIFIGRTAAGDTVMKSGQHRDRVAAQHNVIAFEMEGAGVWDQLPCIIIKGICDYADSHKNKNWQPFAAATAASVMKAVVVRYAHTD
ncbi:Aminodeoxyfutalosine nucleosidase [Paramyrothecium foliicola]|nr:Aminodeoxyfutalosine nucleosidase [Paramyrothecium foliicola]